jgi:hypothetical protein
LTDAVPNPHGARVAALTVAVRDVVVDQRKVLQMLDRRGELQGGRGRLPEQFARDDGQRGSQTLPTAVDLVGDGRA